jgi:hypothetical protein
MGTLDVHGYFCDHTILCAQRKVDLVDWKKFTDDEVKASADYDLGFLVAVVCSRLISAHYYLVLTGEGVRTAGGFHTYPETIRQFQIPKLDFAKTADCVFHTEVSELGRQAVDAKTKLALATTEKDQKFYSRRFENADREIDSRLYEFYGLTADEIARAEEIAV